MTKAINFTAHHTRTALIVDSYRVKGILVTALLASFISWLLKVFDSAGNTGDYIKTFT